MKFPKNARRSTNVEYALGGAVRKTPWPQDTIDRVKLGQHLQDEVDALLVSSEAFRNTTPKDRSNYRKAIDEARAVSYDGRSGGGSGRANPSEDRKIQAMRNYSIQAVRQVGQKPQRANRIPILSPADIRREYKFK